MENFKEKYGNYLLPALCFVTGIVIGIVLAPMKNGKITILSNNTIGSGNGSENKAGDLMTGASQKNHGDNK